MEREISGVSVRIDGSERLSTARVAGHDSTPYVKVVPFVEAVVAWMDKEDGAKEERFAPSPALGEFFRGRVLFQIEEGGVMKAFIMPDGEGGGEIPWGNSGGWDGTVFLPGMGQ